MSLCPCGSEKPYSHCCGPFITGKQLPSAPEQLMRSRYTAYTQADVDYIESTMQGPAKEHFDKEQAKAWSELAKWQGLQVLNSCIDANNKNVGYVEFIASYTMNNKIQQIHEISEFHLENDHWYYVNGKLCQEKQPKVKWGRNDPCPCGSGKKYKKCCGKD